MHPADHKSRHRVREETMTRTYQNTKNTIYSDAATYVNGKDAVGTAIKSKLNQ